MDDGKEDDAYSNTRYFRERADLPGDRLRYLANKLRRRISRQAREELATLIEAAALAFEGEQDPKKRGDAVARALRLTGRPGRKKKYYRDADLWRFIAGRCQSRAFAKADAIFARGGDVEVYEAMFEPFYGTKGTEEDYRIAGKIFDLSPKSVKNIYLRMRKAIEDSFKKTMDDLQQGAD